MNYVAPTLAFLLLSCAARGQNFPDRIVLVDPLADTSRNRSGWNWLPGTILYAEFSRYLNSSGSDHRWNARTGGALEILRIDDRWSVHAMGTVEVVVDPQNDIAFNPRAIFWEEGLFVERRMGARSGLQFGYMHRCKHDIDNLEVLILRGATEQRTLIFSGPSFRYLERPRRIDDTDFEWGGALREDLFLHLLDDRLPPESRSAGRTMESAIAATTVDLRVRWRPAEGHVACAVMAGVMVTAFGDTSGFTERFSDITLFGSLSYLEFGIDFFNPDGGSLVLFARAESQRDAAILSRPQSKNLVMIGIRMGSWAVTW